MCEVPCQHADLQQAAASGQQFCTTHASSLHIAQSLMHDHCGGLMRTARTFGAVALQCLARSRPLIQDSQKKKKKKDFAYTRLLLTLMTMALPAKTAAERGLKTLWKG